MSGNKADEDKDSGDEGEFLEGVDVGRTGLNTCATPTKDSLAKRALICKIPQEAESSSMLDISVKKQIHLKAWMFSLIGFKW